MNISNIRGMVLPLLIFLVVVSAPSVQAAIVTWRLSGVTFEDGGTATGSFKYDASSNQYSEILISTTPGSAFTGNQYIDKVNVDTPSALTAVSGAATSDLTGETFFVMQFSLPLTDAGGTISLEIPGGNNREGVCTSADCMFGNSLRSTTAGSVTTIPIPPAVWLFSSGLLGLVGISRRK